MTMAEFTMIFKRLCANYTKDPARMTDKEELLYNRFKQEDYYLFDRAVDNTCDNSKYFPTISDIIKELRPMKPDRKDGIPEFTHCEVCNNIGRAVSSFIVKHTERGRNLHRAIEFPDKNDHEIKEYHVFCLCEHGDWLYRQCGSEGVRLSHSEFAR